MYFVELKSCNIQESLDCGGFCCATNAPTADWCNSDFDFNVDADIDVDVGVDVDVDVDVEDVVLDLLLVFLVCCWCFRYVVSSPFHARPALDPVHQLMVKSCFVVCKIKASRVMEMAVLMITVINKLF